ncbi:pre-tRNA nuclear export protein [Xylographa opegraphella]|nr:pre-tRNA nuclear export protein [Xylographa opegraphella]
MDAQIENAIEIAWNPQSDQNLKSQAFEFLNQLRSEPQGWQVCLALAIREPRASEVVRHVALEVVNNTIQGHQVDEPGMLFVRDSLMHHIRANYGAGSRIAQQDPVAIQNKISQTITFLFVALYPNQWQTFFVDFLSLASTSNTSGAENFLGTALYLKILISVHDEIADTIVRRSPEEQQRDNDLKDAVRERDARMISQSWQDILLYWKTRDGRIIDQCLSAIGRWASWTDLSLIVKDPLLSLLFELVSSPEAIPQKEGRNNLRDVSLNTFMEILAKKTKANDKLDLIGILRVKDVVSQLITSPLLHELRPTSNYDTDLAETVAKLVNNTVFDIINVLETAPAGDSVVLKANIQLKEFLPFVLRFFADEYDEICSSVIPCLTDLLTYFRKKVRADVEYAPMLPPILHAIVAKMRYDETSAWGNEDAQTDEAEFQDLRKRLQVLQQAVAAVDEQLYIDTISGIVGASLENFQSQRGQVDWRDIDLAMHEMFLFGELAVKSTGLFSKTKPVSPAAERLIAMMFKLVESDVASFSHPAIQLQYMEICVRYSTFFEANPQLIPRVLENFVRFVHHNHVKVKTRSWYLFHRFIKNLRQQLGDVAQNITQALGDLLPIKAELPDETSDNDEMSSDESDRSTDANFTSQLYLYEAIGCMCGSPAVPVANQVIFLQSVINPLFTDLETHLGPARAGDERSALQVHHLIMALGTLARGFSDWTPANTSPSSKPPAEAISEEFARTAEAILVALESLNSSVEIRTAARFAFSRLIGVLGNRVLPQLIRWIDGLLSRTSSKDEMALFLRLLDQVVYGFKSEIFDILNTLLTPFLQRVFSGIAEPTSGTDDEIQLSELKLQYLGFLMVILNNDLGSVLVSGANQPAFETIISTIEHFTKDVTDFPSAKLAFSVLTRMVNSWGGPDIQNTGIAQTAQPSLPGFDRFMMERFSPLCWALPSIPAFNPKDAQGRQVLGEAAGLQRAIYAKTGQEYLTWLRDMELRRMGMNNATIDEYLNALCTFDAKGFRQFFQVSLSFRLYLFAGEGN